MAEAKPETVSTNETNIIFPKDVFRNRFTYLCYELYHYPVSSYWYLAVLILVLTSTLCFHYNDEEGSLDTPAVLSLLFSILITGFTFMLTMSYFGQGLYTSSKLKLCKEVITNKPALNMKSWSIIGANMNKLLYETDEWHTPYFFYNGRSCYYYFDKRIVHKYSGAPKSSTNEDSDEPPTAGNSTQNKTTPAEISNHVENEHDPIDNYYKKARAVHIQSVNDYYKTIYAEYEL